MKLHSALVLFALALSGFAGEKLFNLEITPENLAVWDRYKMKGMTVVEKVDGENQLHLSGKSGPLWVTLDPEKLSGKKLKMVMSFKYSSVPGEPKKNTGFKVLYAGVADGVPFYIQLGPFAGTSDWKIVECTIPAKPKNISSFRLEIASPGGEIMIDELFILNAEQMTNSAGKPPRGTTPSIASGAEGKSPRREEKSTRGITPFIAPGADSRYFAGRDGKGFFQPEFSRCGRTFLPSRNALPLLHCRENHV